MLTTKKILRRETQFPETFVDFAYASSFSSIFCVGLCGKIYDLNIKLFFSVQYDQLTKAKLENWRMLCKPMTSFE